MHRLILTLLLSITCALIHGQVQTTDIKEKPQLKTEQVENRPTKSTSNSLIHTFVCRRCGSENTLSWGFPAKNQHLELIPHCGFCGKKYWPKFKPTGLLERTYCKGDPDSGSTPKVGYN